MKDETFEGKLSKLVAEIATLPENEREKLESLARETRERHEQLKRTFSSMQESLDFIRLATKYMIFDLEATRRENAELRKLLEGE